MLCFLRENRIRKQITQLELANAIGHKYPDPIGKFENGKCPSLYNALRIAYFLGVPVEKIWRLEGFEYHHKKPLVDNLDKLAQAIWEEMQKENPYTEEQDLFEDKFDISSTGFAPPTPKVYKKDYISAKQSK